MSDDLEVLFPEGKTVTANGEQITIKPYTFGQIPKVIGAVRKLAGTMEGDTINVLEAIEKGGEDLIALVMFTTGKPREWFDSLGADEGVALVTAIFEVNKDFLEKRVKPMLPTSLFGTAEPQPGGEASPDSSSDTATAGKTSKATP
jgi:hypothetical protein